MVSQDVTHRTELGPESLPWLANEGYCDKKFIPTSSRVGELIPIFLRARESKLALWRQDGREEGQGDHAKVHGPWSLSRRVGGSLKICSPPR